MLATQRKILLIGPSGSGKSTLCNAIYNNSVEKICLSGPAGTASSALGCTSEVSNYWCDNTLVVTDTIGFDDSRYEPKFLAEELRKMLRYSEVGYEKVFLCFRLGRISEPARVYIRLLKAIFEDPTSNMVLYISGCEDGTDVQEFIQANSKDDDVMPIIHSLLQQEEDYKGKRIVFENIITGSLMVHRKNTIDTRRYLPERKEVWAKIKTVIETDIGVAKVKRPKELWQSIWEWILVFFKKTVVSASSGLKLLWFKSDNIGVKYFYGECGICLEEEQKENTWVLTTCKHKFHKICLEKLSSYEESENSPAEGTEISCPYCKKNVSFSKLMKLP